MHLINQISSKTFNQRIIWLKIFLIIIFIIIFIRSFSLQILDYAELNQIAEKQLQYLKTVQIRRGTIYDNENNILAVSILMDSVFAVPDEIKNTQKTIQTLAKITNLSVKYLQQKISSKSPFIWIKRYLPPFITAEIKKAHLPGIHITKQYKRFYPYPFAAQVIGFTGFDSQGLEGVEYAYHDYLMNNDHQQNILYNFLNFQSFNKNEGNNIQLTLKKYFQYVTESTLKKVVTQMEAENAVAIVMERKTGAILAMVNIPDYNPNHFYLYEQRRYFNRAVGDAYEPGSTFKVITVAAALEHHAINSEHVFFCENGVYSILDRTIHDIHPYAWLTLQEVIQKSSNICAAKIGQLIPKSKWYQTIRDFGFGSKTGIDLPGESSGKIYNYKSWSEIDMATMAYGHTVSVTPIQLITAINAIANDGIKVTPRILKIKQPSTKRIIRSEVAQEIKKYMETVTQKGGTGYHKFFETFPVAGKTGTAQKFDHLRKVYSNDQHIVSFVGFFPVVEPEFTMLVIINEPRKRYHGSKSAVPAFAEIAKKISQHFHPPHHHSVTVNANDDLQDSIFK